MAHLGHHLAAISLGLTRSAGLGVPLHLKPDNYLRQYEAQRGTVEPKPSLAGEIRSWGPYVPCTSNDSELGLTVH